MRSLEGRYGVATMTPAHVKIKGTKVTINFTGKSGVENSRSLRHKEVADALSRYVKGGNKRNKQMFNRTALVTAREALPGGMKLKDWRTILSADEAIKALDSVVEVPKLTGDAKKDKRLLAKVLMEASRSVAKALNNTASVARKNYVPPQVFRQWAIERVGADPSLFEGESK